VPKTDLDFSHSLYNKEAIDATRDAYSGLLSVTLSHDENNSHASFDSDDENGPMLVDAFCNHALFLTIQRFRDGESA
jgi:hypothetical protein